MTIVYVPNQTNTASYVSSLTIGSLVGYRISGGGILGPKPYMQTTLTLNGVSQSLTSINTQTRILQISESDPVGRFEAYVGVAGTRKAITLTNLGNSDILVSEPVFSNRLTTAVPRYLQLMKPPWTISSGSSRMFLLSYAGNEEGDFDESIFFPTPNASIPYYRYDTVVYSRSGYTYSISPSSYSTTTYRIGENTVVDYDITARYLGTIDQSYSVPYTVNLQADPAWSYDALEDNRISLRFSSKGLAYTTATYVATLTVTVPNDSFTIISTATHSVDTLYNYNSSTWYSFLSKPDAIVGCRIDYLRSSATATTKTRLLTIGVGSGGDGAPLYRDGGSLYFDTANLAPMEVTAREKFAYWRTVYQIPLIGTNTERVYFSNDYRVKTQEPLLRDYDYYYGQGPSLNSMFTIKEDSQGAVRITINEVRETSGDADIDGTLDRLERIFYLNVPSDETAGYRTAPQQEPLLNDYGQGDSGGTNTHLFLGFDRYDKVMLSLVPYPT